MACNKQNTQYSTHFPRLDGGSRRNLWIGNRGSELGTFHGTGRKAYHFQFVIVFVCISFFCFSLFTPPLLPPPLLYQCDSVTCCSFAAFAFALHVICMTKEQEKMSEMSEMSCQLTARANQYKNKSNNKWRDYQIPIREWASWLVKGSRKKSSSNQNLFLVCWTKLIQFASINIFMYITLLRE